MKSVGIRALDHNLKRTLKEAEKGPVVITTYGRPTHVLIGIGQDSLMEWALQQVPADIRALAIDERTRMQAKDELIDKRNGGLAEFWERAFEEMKNARLDHVVCAVHDVSVGRPEYWEEHSKRHHDGRRFPVKWREDSDVPA